MHYAESSASAGRGLLHFDRLRRRFVASWPSVTLRTFLMALMLIATLPVVVLMGVRIFNDLEAREARAWLELERSARTASQGGERELIATIETLTTLGRATLLSSGDTRAFERALQAGPRLRQNWHGVFLADANGKLLSDSLASDNDPGTAGMSQRQAGEVLRLHPGSAPVVSGLVRKGAGNRYATAVSVPLTDAGELRYVVGAWLDIASWEELLQGSLPSGGFVTLVDREHRVMARTRFQDHFVGRFMPDGRIGRSPAGRVESVQIDPGGSEPVHLAWQQVPTSGWSVIVGMPSARVELARQQALVMTIGGGLLSVVLGLYLAFLAARHLVLPLGRLASGSRSQRDGYIAVREVAALRDALDDARERDVQARLRLQATASEFETLFSSSPTGLAFAHDPQCRQVTCNPAMDRLFGVQGGPAPKVQVLHQGEQLEESLQPLRRAAATGTPVPPMELEIIVEGGQRRHVLAQAVPLHDARGEARGAIAAYVDITDRVRSDAQLLNANRRLRQTQHLVDLAQEVGHVGYFHYNFVDKELSWTRGQVALFGMESEANVPRARLLRHWARRIDRKHRLRMAKTLRDVFASRQEKETFEYRVTLSDGSTRWLSSRVLFVYGEDHRPEQMIGVTVDMTDEKRAQSERARLTALEHAARLEAESASRAKDEFLAMLGHELRNPLSAIAAAVEVLGRVPGNDAVAANARSIAARQTRHLARMMDDLLDVGRVIAGKVLLVRRPVDLGLIARRVAATLDVTGEAHGHSLRLELGQAWIDADATRLEQVITNLVTNAIKYTPAGCALTLSVAVEHGTAVLRVRDNGPGIPESLLPHIFDLFVQGERTPDRRAGGLGIGLTVTRRLVELHGGTIDVVSSRNGSLFEVRLPAIEPSRDEESLPGAGRPAGRQVVLVEDNEDALSGLLAALELDGHSVLAARDGPSGLKAVLDTQPDVAIVDIGLPGMTGLELARRSRAEGYTGMLIALSGYGREQDVKQALACGFDRHLVKPVDGFQLQRLLAEA